MKVTVPAAAPTATMTRSARARPSRARGFQSMWVRALPSASCAFTMPALRASSRRSLAALRSTSAATSATRHRHPAAVARSTLRSAGGPLTSTATAPSVPTSLCATLGRLPITLHSPSFPCTLGRRHRRLRSLVAGAAQTTPRQSRATIPRAATRMPFGSRRRAAFSGASRRVYPSTVATSTTPPSQTSRARSSKTRAEAARAGMASRHSPMA